MTFIGWDIQPDVDIKHEMHPDINVELLRLAAAQRKFVFTKWLRWYWHIIRTLIKGKFDIVHCVDEYPVVMIFCFKNILFRFLIMDVYDSIIKRKTNNYLAKLVFRAVRFLSNAVADRIIETSNELRDTLGRFRSKTIVLFNSPPDPYVYIDGIWPSPESPLRIAATGAIDSKSMALALLLSAIDSMPSASVEVLCSGWLVDDYAKNVFTKHPAVKYTWIETQAEYYKLIAFCDVVYNVRVDADNSYYRSLVFPQKVFDALSTGRPVIVASENWTSEWIERNKTGWSCSYKDPEALRDLLLFIKGKRTELPDYAIRCRSLYLNHYTWEIMEQRLISLYDELNRISS